MKQSLTSGWIVLFGMAFAVADPAEARTPSTQEGPTAERARSTEAALQGWRAQHGARWTARIDARTGRAYSLLGARRPAEVLPVTDEDWIELGARRVEEVRPLFGIRAEELVPSEVKHLDLVRIGTVDKTAVLFDQVLDGVPVDGGHVALLFGPDGELLCVDSGGLPDVEEPVLGPVIPPAAAMAFAGAEFGRVEGVSATDAGEIELLVVADPVDGPLRPRLAWAVELSAFDGAGPHGQRILVAADVLDGEILSSHGTVHRFHSPVGAQSAQSAQSAPGNPLGGPVSSPPLEGNRASYTSTPLGPRTYVDGHVEAYATPGTQADWNGNTPTPHALPNMSVYSPLGNTLTELDGSFSFLNPGLARLKARFRYFGKWARIVNGAGKNATLTVDVTPQGNQTWTMNQPPTEFETAQANAFIHVNRFRQWVVDLDPTDKHMNFRARAEVNLSGAECNAYWTSAPAGVHFFRASGGCRNSAFSTAIGHEMGHWANARYKSNNGSDGFGEGAADTWAMYIYDTPIVADQIAPSAYWRSGWNFTPYCGDGNGGCHGQVHKDGEVLMGALWKVRHNLGISLGDALGDLTADVLFLSWMQAFNDKTIDSIIEEHWLLLDDDDGDLFNGTPNFAAINGGFVAQGFPGVGLSATEELVLQAADAASLDVYGTSVGVYGSNVAVGAPHPAGASLGAVYVYNAVSGQQRFKLSSGTLDDEFGDAVAVHGSRVAVGAPGVGSGSAYLFSTSNGAQLKVLSASDGVSGDYFGASIAIDGTRVVVGAPSEDHGGFSSVGAAYVFSTSGAQLAKLISSDGASADLLGISVDISGTTAIVGAYADDDAGSQSGSAYLFDATTGQQLHKLVASDAAAGDNFALSVAIDGNRALVGAYDHEVGGVSVGAAYLFDVATGAQLFKWTASDATAGADFGFAVALSGNRAVVGAKRADGLGSGEGATYVFDVNTGQELDKLTGSLAASDDGFGYAVAFDGTRAVIGAPYDDDAGSQSGSAYVFTIP